MGWGLCYNTFWCTDLFFWDGLGVFFYIFILEIFKMRIIHVPAVRIRQGNMTLYAASIAVRDLVTRGFFSIERLDPAGADNQGYQRVLHQARAKRLADFIINGQEAEDVLIPTSVFLATDGDVEYDDSARSIVLELPLALPFSVVDGQHRLHGFKMAVEATEGEVREKILNFEVPVNIAVNLSKIHQMSHFLLVNTTQKVVDKAVEQRIIARLTDMQKTEGMLRLPKWIEKRVRTGDDRRAVSLIEYLSDTEDSPWRGKIELANKTVRGALKEKSFNSALVKFVVNSQSPLASEDVAEAQKIFLNYWRALANILDDGAESVLYKFNGVHLFCQFSTPFLMKVDSQYGKFTVSVMQDMLRACFDNLEGEYEVVGMPSYWHSGGGAGSWNNAKIREIYFEMTNALRSV